MQQSYLPPVDTKELCDVLKLCSVRGKNVAVKLRCGSIYELPISDVMNSEIYDGFPIVRTYSSGHVFLDETRTRVYLLTTEKDGKIQHQFTGGSPLEDANKEVIRRTADGKIGFHLDKVEDNAIIRTFNRTGVKVTEAYNDIPLVDWALLENIDPEKKGFFRLVCLMHYVVKQYEGILTFRSGMENVIDGNWYNIEKLEKTPNVAPNAYIVSKKAQEIAK